MMVRQYQKPGIPCGDYLRENLKWVTLLVFVMLLFGCSKTVIEVNGEKVKKDVFDQEVKERQLLHEGKPVAVSDELLKKSAVTAIINRVIVLQEAEKEGMDLTKEEFAEGWERFRTRFKNDEEFKKYLGQRNMSARDMKTRVRQSLIIDKLYQHIHRGMTVSDDEVRRYYLSQNWKNIGPIQMKVGIIKTSSMSDAEQIVSEIRASTFEQVFWEVVKKRRSGADAQAPFWVDPDSYDPAKLKIIQEIFTGQYRGPVKIKNTWHIIKVFERKAKIPHFEAIKDELRASLLEKKSKEYIDRLIRERVATAPIKVYSDRLSFPR